MSDYIDRQAAIDAIPEVEADIFENCGRCELLTKEDVVEILKGLPSAEAEPVKRGKWEITEAYPHNVYCSVCHKRFAQTHWAVWEDGSLPRAYCPNCGAKMAPISASPENGQEQRRSPDASL